MVSRVERTPFAGWWWTVDRLMLAALIVLMLGGIVLSLAASPPVAARLNLEPFYFVNRHVLYLIPALAVLLATSFLSSRSIRRLALAVFIVSLVLVVATLFFGAEVKGARRWIVILGVNIQPSEFLKPAFVILIPGCSANPRAVRKCRRTPRRSSYCSRPWALSCCNPISGKRCW
jgi:cell division protein FtsW